MNLLKYQIIKLITTQDTLFTMTVEMALPIEFSESAATKVKTLIDEENNPEL